MPTDLIVPSTELRASSATRSDTPPASNPLGPPPQVVINGAALRARAAIKSSIFAGQELLAPQIGRFIVLRELGRGGMGVVYVAYDETLDRRVALKLLYELASDDLDGQARLLREAQAMARLNHPNIAAVYEAGTHDGRVYVAMEFVQGKPLDRWLREKPRPWREVVEVFIQAGRGLHAAHVAGLVHRDFKPANVMLGGDGRVRVLDFGLARGIRAIATDATLGPLATMSVTLPISPPGGALTREGTIVGTPAYMPPEQFRGQPIDSRADQYALCVSLHEGLYGQLPFRGETLPALWAAVLDGPPRTPPKGPRVPGWLYRVLLRGLDPEPANRFPSMTALLAQLEQRPGRRLRNWMLAGLGVAAFAGGLYGAERARDAQCTFGEEELAGLWDFDRKAELRARFAAQEPPIPEAWNAAEQQIDETAARWLADRGTVCTANSDGKEPFAVYERRQFCLTKYKLLLRGTLDAIVSTSELTREGLDAMIVAFKERQLDCTSESSRDWRPEPPPKHQADAVERLSVEYFSLMAKNTDVFDPVRLTAARKLAAETEALGYRPLLVYTLWLRSVLESQAGLEREYCTSLQESYYLADATGIELQAAYNAAHILEACHDFGMREPRLADTWARLALAKVERMDRIGGDLHVVLLTRIASAMLDLDRPDEAARYILQGLKLVQAAPARFAEDTDASGAAKLIFTLAHRFLTLPVHESLIREVSTTTDETVRTLHGGTSSDAGLARSFIYQTESYLVAGRLVDAQNSAEAGLRSLKASSPGDHASMAQLLAGAINAALSQERCHDALMRVNNALEAMDMCQEEDIESRATVLGLVVAIESTCGDLVRANSFLTRLRSLFAAAERPPLPLLFAEAAYEMESEGDVRAIYLTEQLLAQIKMFESVYPSIGVSATIMHAEVSSRAHDNHKARRSAEQAIDLGEKAWGRSHLFLASPLTVLGKVELADGNFDAAIAHLERALALRNASDPQFRADTRFALARSLLKKSGGVKRAREAGERALAEFAAAGPRRATERAKVAAWLAKLPRK